MALCNEASPLTVKIDYVSKKTFRSRKQKHNNYEQRVQFPAQKDKRALTDICDVIPLHDNVRAVFA